MSFREASRLQAQAVRIMRAFSGWEISFVIRVRKNGHFSGYGVVPARSVAPAGAGGFYRQSLPPKPLPKGGVGVG